MSVADVNRPEIVAEVRAAFERYEDALVNNRIEVLDALFWRSPHTVRYGATENLYGHAAIAAFRAARASAGLARALGRTEIVTFGADVACVSTEFHRAASNALGRQSQTWVRMPEGWRVVAAHVSLLGVSADLAAG